MINFKKYFLSCAALILASQLLTAKTKSLNLNDGEKLDITPKLTAYTRDSDIIKLTPQTEGDLSFLRVTTKKLIKSSWGSTVLFNVPEGAKKDDTLLMKIKVRGVETANPSGLGHIELFYQVFDEKTRKSALSRSFDLNNKWKTYYFSFKCPMDSTKKGQLFFLLGGIEKQTFDVAELSIVNFKNKPIEELPDTKLTYIGMEKDATWRKEALARIEKFRKNTVKVKVITKSGEPISNANIVANLKSHKFGFGANINALNYFAPNTPKEKRDFILKTLLKSHNIFVLNNSLKWRHYHKDIVDQVVQWARKNEVPLRGHTMVWGRFSSAPVDIEKKKDFYEKNPEAFKKVISDRIKFCANLYPDVITEWDVINEPAAEQKFAKILGENAMTEWINLAKKLAPKTLTCTNDYNIIAGFDMQHREDYIKIIEELEKKSAKLDTIGLQAHFGSPIPPAEVLSRIRLFKKFNKDLILTEFTIEVNDEDIKANFVRDMLILTYSIPQVRGLLTWSVEDFYNENWTPNKAGREWNKLVNKTWHTKLNTRTNQNGEFVIKGYKGKYIVNIRVGSKVIRKEFLLDNKKEVTIRL